MTQRIEYARLAEREREDIPDAATINDIVSILEKYPIEELAGADGTQRKRRFALARLVSGMASLSSMNTQLVAGVIWLLYNDPNTKGLRNIQKRDLNTVMGKNRESATPNISDDMDEDERKMLIRQSMLRLKTTIYRYGYHIKEYVNETRKRRGVPVADTMSS